MTDAQDRDAALDRLISVVQPDLEPTLSDTELEDILDQSTRAVRWTTVTALGIGALVLPSVYNGHYYQVTTAGTTAVSEPSAWSTSQGGTVTSGTVVFQEAGLYPYSSLYDVRAASRKCWELKAAKSAELISSSESGGEQMIHDHCVAQARYYSTPVIA